MIRSRNPRSLAVFVTPAAFGLLLAVQTGCGGDSKPAESASCPTGTVLHGKDCLPDDDAESSSKSSDSSSEKPSKSASNDSDSSEESTPAPAPKKKPKPAPSPEADAPSNAGGSASYDKDAVLPILKRTVAQIKNNCGAATNEDGESGPWGKTKVTVTLGRNGHTKSTAVAPEFDGKPAGQCIIQAFKKLVFPPYDASSDESIELDLDVKKPAGK